MNMFAKMSLYYYNCCAKSTGIIRISLKVRTFPFLRMSHAAGRPTSPTVRTLMSHEKSPGPNIDLLPSSPLQTTEFVLPPRAQGAEEATGVNRSPPNNLNLKPLGSPKKLEALATSFSSPDRKSVLPPPVFSPVTSRFPTPVAKPLTGGSVEDVALEKVIEALALPADEDDFVPEEILEDETSSLHDLDRSIANTSPPRQLNMDDLADDDEDEVRLM